MKTIYIANDGKEFDTETACLEYEKLGAESIEKENMLREIHFERIGDTVIKNNAMQMMQRMKSSGGIEPSEKKPTINDVFDCKYNLSCIEAIYKK